MSQFLPRITDTDAIENMIDTATNGVPDLLDAIAEICAGKADHIRVNWQDYPGAKQWDETARMIERLSNDLKLKGLGL